MIMEKKWSKGSFLSFFDWNGKSQKKLFSHNPILPDVANQAKENIEIMPMSQIKMDENGESPSSIAFSDFSFALSVSSDDEECETNSPGLVARLMGLDSLPPVSSLSHEIALHSRNDYCHVDSINMALKSNNSCSDNIEASTMERFLNETLNHRFAKSISVTHDKLLSPVKSHGYMKPKNAAHIVGEESPQPYTRNRMSSVGPLSASLRTLELREKSEAAHHESKFNVNGKPTQRRSSLYNSTPTFKDSRDSENSSSPHGKGKSVSFVTPSKTNAHSRDRVSLNGNRRNVKQKEKEIKSNQKICNGQNRNLVRQNSITSKGKSTSKVDTNKPTQTRSSESLTRARKTTNKCAVNSNTESNRSRTRVTDKKKEYSVSKGKSCLQKKRYMSTDDRNDALGSDNAVNTYESKSIKCNVTIDESIYNDAFSMKESNDVISFTFTSPLRRNMPESRSTTEQATSKRTGIDIDPENLSLSPTRFHVIDGDALSVMLSHVNLPQCTLEVEDSSVGFKSISVDRFNSMICNTSRKHGNSFHLNLLSDNFDSIDDNCCSSSDNMLLSMNQQLQISEPLEDPRCSSNIESCRRSERMMELEYVKNILISAELMAEKLTVNETENMIMPTLFDTLENQRTEVESYEVHSKLQRRAIFDCVSECLRSKCRQVFVARCKAWPRWVTFMRKRWLAEEVYKEMSEFRSMEEEVVMDEIIRKDMCIPLGRWLDFDIEAFENGLEIELDIVTFLIDELVSDLWLI